MLTLYIYVYPLTKEAEFHTSTKSHTQVDCVYSNFNIVSPFRSYIGPRPTV
jgi:hypothetical protein